ncbi:MAG: enolase [Clostridiaceae bacterium]|jgi:hypothetical protein|nr:enolase [Clostridiaceae bacterium]
MDITSLGMPTMASITAICLVVGMGAKASALADKWIPVVCAVSGMVLGVCGLWIMPDFPAQDVVNAAAVGAVSGLASTGLNQVFKQMKK